MYLSCTGTRLAPRADRNIFDHAIVQSVGNEVHAGDGSYRKSATNMARTMEQMEQLLGHALVRVEAVEKLHDRHEAETKSLMHEWRAEARVAAQLIQALQAQVVQLTSRVSTLDEALLAERRRNEQLSQERAERLRAQAEASENALREQFRALSARVEAQVDQGETSLRDYASQLRAQADASEGVLRQEIARLRSEAAVSLSAASPNSSRPPTAAELGPRAVASSQPAAWRTAPIASASEWQASYRAAAVDAGLHQMLPKLLPDLVKPLDMKLVCEMLAYLVDVVEGANSAVRSDGPLVAL